MLLKLIFLLFIYQAKSLDHFDSCIKIVNIKKYIFIYSGYYIGWFVSNIYTKKT